MEKEKQTSTFNEELEKDYDFKIEEGRVDGGANGSISYGTMCTKIGVKNKIPVVLKEVSKKTMGYFKRIANIHFDNEKQFFKDIEKLGVNCDYIVKCYGTTHIGEKEHIVMEDLSKDEFVPTTQLFEITELYKTYSNQIIRATKKT